MAVYCTASPGCRSVWFRRRVSGRGSGTRESASASLDACSCPDDEQERPGRGQNGHSNHDAFPRLANANPPPGQREQKQSPPRTLATPQPPLPKGSTQAMVRLLPALKMQKRQSGADYEHSRKVHGESGPESDDPGS
jgi:hypothetical protein